MIDPGEDRHLWAQEYKRRPEDILAMESEVAHAIALRVSSTLNPAQRPRVIARSVDPGIYDLWLLGRYHSSKRTIADFAEAKSYFEQATARDPGYAPAYAGLAEVLALSPQYGPVSVEAALPQASAAAEHAIQLDDNLAEAHAILGFIEVTGNQWRQSEAEFRRALAIDPSLAEAHHWIAYLLFFLGRRDEAVAEIAKARELDPLSAITNADEGHFLYAMRDFDEARVRLLRSIELAPELGYLGSEFSRVGRDRVGAAGSCLGIARAKPGSQYLQHPSARPVARIREARPGRALPKAFGRRSLTAGYFSENPGWLVVQMNLSQCMSAAIFSSALLL